MTRTPFLLVLAGCGSSPLQAPPAASPSAATTDAAPPPAPDSTPLAVRCVRYCAAEIPTPIATAALDRAANAILVDLAVPIDHPWITAFASQTGQGALGAVHYAGAVRYIGCQSLAGGDCAVIVHELTPDLFDRVQLQVPTSSSGRVSIEFSSSYCNGVRCTRATRLLAEGVVGP